MKTKCFIGRENDELDSGSDGKMRILKNDDHNTVRNNEIEEKIFEVEKEKEKEKEDGS
jgi:hypothetical protein